LDLAVELFDCVVVPPLEAEAQDLHRTFAFDRQELLRLGERVCILIGAGRLIGDLHRTPLGA